MKRGVLALCALFLPAIAAAVEVNSAGGQALIYPYYTVQSAQGNAWNTYVSLVNLSLSTLAVRVRFRESRNGREVLAFNLFLEPSDMWTGAVVPDSTNPASAARLITSDSSCVSPQLASGGTPFRNDAFSGANDDGLGSGLDRTREGYIEVIEMASITGASAVAASHVNGTPKACDSLRVPGAVPAANVAAPLSSLFGTVTWINVNSGMDLGMNAEALSSLSTQPFYREPADPYPDWNASEIDPIANIAANGIHYHLAFDRPLDAVSAALMRQEIDNEYILDANTASSSAWVMTFPTRRFYAAGEAPFADAACVPASWQVYDREGVVQPLPPRACDGATCASASRLCGGALDLEWGTSSLFGSALPVLPPATPAASGWARALIDRDAQGGVRTGLRSRADSSAWNVATGAVTTGRFELRGAPVVGFAGRSFRNGTLQCATFSGTTACQGNYGGSFPHRYKRVIVPAP